MQTVQCPHCAAHIANDGSLSNQVSSCFACRGEFQMPPLAPAPAAQPPDFDDGPTRRRRPRKAGDGGMMLFALVVLPLCTLVVSLGVFLYAVSENKGEKPAPPRPKNGAKPRKAAGVSASVPR